MLIQRYILKELSKLFLFIFFCLSLVVLLGFSVQQLMHYKGVGVEVLVKLLPYMLGYVISYTAPVSLLLAGVIFYRGMANRNEIIAARAAGIPRTTLARPSLLLAMLLTLFLIYLQFNVMPESHYTRENLGATSLSEVLANSSRSNRTFRMNNTVFRFGSVENGQLQNVHVLELFDSGTPKRWFVARSGKFTKLPSVSQPNLEFKLNNVTITYWNKENESEQHQILHFKDKPFVYSRNMRREMGMEKRELDDMKMNHMMQLMMYEEPPDHLLDVPKRLVKMEINKRYASAFSPLALVFLGIPLAMRTGSSTNIRGIGIGTLPALIFFYPSLILAERLCLVYDLNPIYLFWPPLIIFSILGYILLHRE